MNFRATAATNGEEMAKNAAAGQITASAQLTSPYKMG
jgi:hypothetical protein